MPSETLQDFIQQAESYLPVIRGSILVCLQDENTGRELNAALRQTILIKDKAAEHGLNEIKRVAGELEKELETIIAAQIRLSEDQSRKLLDKLAVLEALLTKITFKVDFFPADIDNFIEDSFENLQIKPRSQPSIEEPSSNQEVEEQFEEEEEEFEIDEEMLEIFALEAEELVQNVNVHLTILEENPNNREALLEVRRNAHTLKGSAGIIGLKQLSELAHRVEDLLDHLAENEIEGNEKIFEILLASTDCFSALAGNENSPQLAKKIARLYQNFDDIFASFKKKSKPHLSNNKFQFSNQQPGFSRLYPENDQEQQTKTEERFANPPAENANSKSVVRVSLEKLDELIKLVGDLAISRSIFERYLLELEQQNNELRNNNNRLQRSTGKLESEFEADVLQSSSSRFQIPNSLPKINAFPASNEFDTLEFDRYTEFHQTTRELVETAADTYVINNELDALKNNLEIMFDSQRRLIEEMQERLLRLRLVKFGVLSARFQRIVRVTCEEEGKSADLFIEGENQEFDTQILDSLVEPLLHVLRNAVAHGIEPAETRRLVGKNERGKISLCAQSEGTHVNLTISDDGRGVSVASLIEKAVQNNFITPDEAANMGEEEAFSLMFLPGLTTADKLSQVAGRGVGMNIVKTNILRQQGTITVHSEVQKGTTFTIRLPLALALTRALIVKSGGQTFAFPSKSVKQVAEISLKDIDRNTVPNTIRVNNENHSIFCFNEILDLPATKASGAEESPILILEILEKPSALVVDEIIAIEEIVIKPLGAPLQNSQQYIGATILGNGQIVPVLDLIYLLGREIQNPQPKIQHQETAQDFILAPNTPPQNQQANIRTVMIVDDSPTVRHLTSNSIKSAGWQAITAKDGMEALEILQSSQELPDVILTDVEMPRMNGYELLAALKRQENLEAIPVVMITSRSGEKHKQKAIDLGVAEYFIKPYSEAVLLSRIKDLAK